VQEEEAPREMNMVEALMVCLDWGEDLRERI